MSEESGLRYEFVSGGWKATAGIAEVLSRLSGLESDYPQLVLEEI